MHKPHPKYGWHGQDAPPIPSKHLVRWTGEAPEPIIRLRYEGVVRDVVITTSRDIRKIVKRKPDPSIVPEAHFHFDLAQ